MPMRGVNLDLPVSGMSDGSVPGSPVSYACDVFPHRGMLVSRRGRVEMSSFASKNFANPDIRSIGNLDNTSLVVYDMSSGVNSVGYGVSSAWKTMELPSYFDGAIGVGISPDGYGGWIQCGDELIISDGGSAGGLRYGYGYGFVRWAGAIPTTSPGVSTLTARVSTAVGSKTISGTANTFSNTMLNCYITVKSSTANVYQCRRIVKYISDTKIVVDAPMDETLTGRDAAVSHIGLLTGSFKNTTITDGYGLFNVCRTSSVNYSSQVNSGATAINALIPNGATAAFHKGRLFVGNIVDSTYQASTASEVLKRSRIRWSGVGSRDTSSTVGEGISYWDYNGYVDVDDRGGIVGLASFNGDLIVLNKSSVGIIRGDFATDGSDNGATYSVLDPNGGAESAKSWCVGTDGVYWMNQLGVFVWDGSKITEISSPIRTTWKTTIAESAYEIFDISDRVIVSYNDLSGGSSHWHALSFVKGVSGWFDSTGGDGLSGYLGTLPPTKAQYLDGSYVAMYRGNPSSGTNSLRPFNWTADFDGDAFGALAKDANGNVVAPRVSTQSENIGSTFRVKEVGVDASNLAISSGANVTASAITGNRGSMQTPDTKSSLTAASGSISLGTSIGPQFNRISLSNVSGPSARLGSSRILSIELSVADTATPAGSPDIRFFNPITAYLDIDDLMENQ